MMITNSIILLLFTLVAIMIIDLNVLDYTILLFRRFILYIQRSVWLVVNHPFFYVNPLGKKLILLKYYIQSFKLRKEFLNKE